ncbi:hypothetical protein [Rhodoplanes sp. Z2-YC6860]|uniref:hypothetical protein n=1 Tax=Rhodoplanes sp. Z2-YC6860 TaxID=674703 RepID=UPI000831F892|nr:hypothetical protein [Rhodoplanes sp. Z2-YC6860]
MSRAPWGSAETSSHWRGYKVMEQTLEKALNLAERIIMHIEHEVPPEAEVVAELKTLIPKLRKERGFASPVDSARPGGHVGQHPPDGSEEPG